MPEAIELSPFEITEQEAARLLRIKPPTLAHWRKCGNAPPYFRAGRIIRYSAAGLLAWQQDQVVQPERRTA